MFCGASQLWALIYFEFLATLITENAFVKSRDMLSGYVFMCFIEFQLGKVVISMVIIAGCIN